MRDNVNRGDKELCRDFETSTSPDSIELLHCSRYPEEALYEILRLRKEIASLKAALAHMHKPMVCGHPQVCLVEKYVRPTGEPGFSYPKVCLVCEAVAKARVQYALVDAAGEFAKVREDLLAQLWQEVCRAEYPDNGTISTAEVWRICDRLRGGK